MDFREDFLVYALASREAEAKSFMAFFRPEWLRNAEYVPILREIYAFTKKFQTPPSLPTLHERLRDLDPETYQNRYKATLDSILAAAPDTSQVLLTLQKARSIAIVRGTEEMVESQHFLQLKRNLDGPGIIQEFSKLARHFQDGTEISIKNLEQTSEELKLKADFLGYNRKITTGIKPVDLWSNGGLRRKQLGIIVAPTGHGKTACLVMATHHIAAVEDLNVMYITNEVSTDEITERFLARISDKTVNISQITEDAIYASGPELTRRWKMGVGQKIVIAEMKPGHTTNDIEAMVLHYTALTGWKPDVIALDYMGRMAPNNAKGMTMDHSWNWLGAIATDLASFSRRSNLLVWTASQTNRGGLSANELTMEMMQGSIQPLQEATSVVATHRKSHTTVEGTKYTAFEFWNWKQRGAHFEHKPMIVKADLSKMMFLDDVLPPEITVPQEEQGDKVDSVTPKARAAYGKKKYRYDG